MSNSTSNDTNYSETEEGDGWLWDDATWILCASFIIFTMQTGEIIVLFFLPDQSDFRFLSNNLTSSLVASLVSNEKILYKFINVFLLKGFGMLESGCVSLKNEVNIMMKNVVDVVLGGVTYWAFGYGLSYGTSYGTNPFFAVGSWFVNADGLEMGPVFTTFLFQLSFATTATTIVSGGIAER